LSQRRLSKSCVGLRCLTQRRVAAVGIMLSGILAYATIAAPASAGPPPPGSGGVGCGGQSCWAYVEGLVRFSGTGYTGAVNGAVAIPPPSCWMQPWMTAAQMYDYYETYIAAGNTGGGSAWAPYAQQIKDLYNSNAQGVWWASNFDGSAGGSVCVGNLPMIQWVAAGAPPPLQWIPPRTLALMALSRMTVQAPALATNPVNNSYVELPTFVKATVSSGLALFVTASIPSDSETVWARAQDLYLSTDGPGRLFQPCGPLGSRYGAAQMAATGPGTTIDCGARYSLPSTGGPYSLSGTLLWRATWNGAFLATLSATSVPVTVPVAEIQSINRGQ